jgi:predicted ferric reductase
MKLTMRAALVVLPLALVAIVVATDQILPATSPYQAQTRIWLAARATGIVGLILLTAEVLSGVLLSHPRQPQWKTSKTIFPWHDSLWVFVFAFLAIHVVSLLVDEYAGVGLGGALVPGLSEYRSAPVAIGVIGLYAFVVTVITARFTRLLPNGLWLRLHRLSAVVLALAWVHGVLAGTDTDALRPLYWSIALSVLAGIVYRYWVTRLASRRRRPAVTPPPGAERAPVPVVQD